MHIKLFQLINRNNITFDDKKSVVWGQDWVFTIDGFTTPGPLVWYLSFSYCNGSKAISTGHSHSGRVWNMIPIKSPTDKRCWSTDCSTAYRNNFPFRYGNSFWWCRNYGRWGTTNLFMTINYNRVNFAHLYPLYLICLVLTVKLSVALITLRNTYKSFVWMFIQTFIWFWGWLTLISRNAFVFIITTGRSGRVCLCIMKEHQRCQNE